MSRWQRMGSRTLISKFKAEMGKNFMTPDVIKIWTRGSRVVELSQGTGFYHEKIYGVTERTFNKGNGLIR